jgi:hypothetical protein
MGFGFCGEDRREDNGIRVLKAYGNFSSKKELFSNMLSMAFLFLFGMQCVC